MDDADLDADGDVDGQDFLAIQQIDPSLIPAWNAQYGSVGAVAAVPEPAAIVLAAWVGLARVALRGRQRNIGLPT